MGKMVIFFYYLIVNLFLFANKKKICLVNAVDGEFLTITKVSRLHMATYLCVASNGVPPSVSKRINLLVQCKIVSFIFINT